jgi:hypothetical protein
VDNRRVQARAQYAQETKLRNSAATRRKYTAALSSCVGNRGDEGKMTKAEKRGCGGWALSVNTPSPAALRRLSGRRTDRRGSRFRRRKGKHTEVRSAGWARKFGALCLFCLLLFDKIVYLKRYAGGLVCFRRTDVCISTPVGFLVGPVTGVSFTV